VPSRRPNVGLSATAMCLTGGVTRTALSWRSIYYRPTRGEVTNPKFVESVYDTAAVKSVSQPRQHDSPRLRSAVNDEALSRLHQSRPAGVAFTCSGLRLGHAASMAHEARAVNCERTQAAGLGPADQTHVATVRRHWWSRLRRAWPE
jgi:hypothetical protein